MWSSEWVADGSWPRTRAHGSCPSQNQAGQDTDGHSLSTVPPTWQGPSSASPSPILPLSPVPWNPLHFLPLKPPCGLPGKQSPHTPSENCPRHSKGRLNEATEGLEGYRSSSRTVGHPGKSCCPGAEEPGKGCCPAPRGSKCPSVTVPLRMHGCDMGVCRPSKMSHSTQHSAGTQ